MKLLEDHLIERRLPIEQRELQTIAQNVIQNLINTERKFSRKFIFVKFFCLFLAPINTLAMSPEQREQLNLVRQRELVRRLKSSIYHWQPLM
jgi:hypothetical protein